MGLPGPGDRCPDLKRPRASRSPLDERCPQIRSRGLASGESAGKKCDSRRWIRYCYTGKATTGHLCLRRSDTLYEAGIDAMAGTGELRQ